MFSESESCRCCSLHISPEIKQAGIEKETEEIRKYQYGLYKITLWSGIGTILLGIFLVIVSALAMVLRIDLVFPWSLVMILAGIGQVIFSFYGFYKERPRRKKK